jgi:hypothetical protein
LRPAVRRLSAAGLSINGVLLFATSFLVMTSGFASLRADIGGLSLHPYLVPVAIAFPLVVVMRLQNFPIRVLVALVIFSGMYVFSAFNGSNVSLSEVLKISSAMVSIVVCALLVRSRKDFVAGAVGLSLAIALLAIKGIQTSGVGGVEVMESANRNSYSLYALPAVLLSGFIVLQPRMASAPIKAILTAFTVATLGAIFMSANRSGYVGAVLIGGMLFWDRRGKGLIYVGALAVAIAAWILLAGRTTVLNERLNQTVHGTKSDTMRRNLFQTCVEIGLENPIIGVSPQALSAELQHRLGGEAFESHNAFAHVIAASGLICFSALLAVGWTLWNWKPSGSMKIGGKGDPLREARYLLRMFVILWFVRGNFTREILYNPSFTIALGLAIGYCVLVEATRNDEIAGSPQLTPQLVPRRLATQD